MRAYLPQGKCKVQRNQITFEEKFDAIKISMRRYIQLLTAREAFVGRKQFEKNVKAHRM